EFDGARVYVDDQPVGYLKATHSYRWGRFEARKEMSAPPRFEANLALDQLALGMHRLRIVKTGYVEYRGTFRNRSSHVEVFIPDDSVREGDRQRFNCSRKDGSSTSRLKRGSCCHSRSC